MKRKLMRLICYFTGHKRGETWSRTGYVNFNQKGNTHWHIVCKRCGFRFDYYSPLARLVSREIQNGFTGE